MAEEKQNEKNEIVEEEYEANFEENEDDIAEEDELESGITKEGVGQATEDMNSIFQEGTAAVKELKEALDDIKDAFNLGGLFKK